MELKELEKKIDDNADLKDILNYLENHLQDQDNHLEAQDKILENLTKGV